MTRTHALVLAAVLMFTGCRTAAGGVPGGPSAPGAPPDAPRIVADRLAFDLSELSVEAGRPWALVFENREAAPHYVAISASDGAPVFEGHVFSGPATVVYEVPALAAGRYAFRCDLHPDMAGVIDAR